MAAFEIKYPKGATPLDPDERSGLIPDCITTQGELNALEQENILEAQQWALKKKKNLLKIDFVLELHKKMFNQVWKWAGLTRTTDKNIGVQWDQVTPKLGELLANTEYRIENQPDDLEQIILEFHHKLVAIHAFPNGNGRHARLITNLLLIQSGKEPFTWGASTSTDTIITEGAIRDDYITALQAADNRNYDLLLKFARS